jgi:hypothetical protein
LTSICGLRQLPVKQEPDVTATPSPNKGPKAIPKASHVLISSMKDEGPFVLEWVAHHLVLGFDRICVASNDCRDGTDRLLQALAVEGFLSHVPNVVPEAEIPQHAGYDRIRRTQGIDAADWLMMLDADEFLNVHIGENLVSDLTGWADPDIDVIALSAMTFSDAPHRNWQPGPVCPMFTTRLPLRHKANAAIKSLTRAPARFKGIHNHHMVGWRGPGLVQVLRGDGVRFELPPDVPIWKRLRNLPQDLISHRLAQYNHYAIKTWDSFQLRRARGRGAVAVTNAETERHTEAYFAERSQGEAQDSSISRYAPQVAALMAEMLTHPKIARRQAEAEAAYAALVQPYRR